MSEKDYFEHKSREEGLLQYRYQPTYRNFEKLPLEIKIEILDMCERLNRDKYVRVLPGEEEK